MNSRLAMTIPDQRMDVVPLPVNAAKRLSVPWRTYS